MGGIRGGTFDPDIPAEDAQVVDVGDIARTISSGRAVLRLDPRVYGERPAEEPAPMEAPSSSHRWPQGLAPPAVPDGHQRSLAEARRELKEWLQQVTLPESALGTQVQLLRGGRWRADVVDGTWVISGLNRLSTSTILALARGEGAPPGDDAITADDGSVASIDPVALDVHLNGVGEWAEALAPRLRPRLLPR